MTTNVGITLSVSGQAAVQSGLAGVTTGLNNVVGATDRASLSAKAYSAALRNVPAQFTDIVTSLQGGQSPLTVLFQQGGQLKDMFGGVGNAAKALGGYVVGLVNPFTLAAGAAAGLSLAYTKGAAESEAYNKALILTGNAAGTTAQSMAAMAKAVSSATNGTVGASAEALAALASTGAIASDQFSKLAQTTVLMQKATGAAVADTVKQFSDLGKDPLTASIKLNEATNYLTESVYKQIKALVNQGDTVAAGVVAQNAYADVMNRRAPELLANLGLIEKAWNGIAGATKEAWDYAKGIGREGDPVANIKKEIAIREGRVRDKYTGALPANDEELNQLRNKLGLLEKVSAYDAMQAKNQAASAEAAKARIAFDAVHDKYLSDATKKEREIAALQSAFARLKSPSNQDIAAYVESIKKVQDVKSTKPSSSAATQAFKEESVAIVAQINAIKLAQSIADKELANTEAVDKRNEALRGYSTEMESAAVKAAALAKADSSLAASVLDAVKTRDATLNDPKSSDAAVSNAKSAYDTTVAQLVVLRDTATVTATIAQENANIAAAQKQALEVVTREKALRADAETAYQGQLAVKQASQQLDAIGLNLTVAQTAELTKQAAIEAANHEYNRVAIEAEKTLQAELNRITLSGATDVKDANLKAGLAYVDAIASASAKSNSAIALANVKSAIAIKTEWQKTADSISNSITDAFMGAITNGESLFENLARSVEKMFSDMVLRPVVEAVVSGTLGTSVTGTAGTSLLSGGLSMSSLGQSASSLAGAFNGSGLGSFATSSMGASLGLSKTVEAVGPALEGAAAPTMNTLTGAGEALSSLPIGGILTAYEIGGVGGFAAGVASTAIAGAIGTLGTATSAMAGATAALGALGPVGWIGLGLAAVLGAGNDSIPSYNTGDSNLTFGSDGVLKTASTEFGNSEASAAYAAGLQGSYAAAIEALGATMAETNFVTGSNSGAEASDPQVVFASSVNGQAYQSTETQAADTAAVELAASRAVFNALQASEMPDYLAGVFDGITASTATQEQITAAIEGAAALKGFHDQLQLMPWDSLKDMTYATTQALVDLSGGLDKLESNLGTYYDKFYTDSEKTSDLTAATADAFAALGITMPTATDGLRDWYRGLVDSVLALDQSDAANAGATVAVLALQTAVDTLAPTFEDAAKAIAEYQSWQDKLDVLNGVTTERAQQQAADLAAASDEATRALINQVYAAEDLATLRQSAMDAVSTAIDAAIGQAEAGKDAAQSAYDALAEDIQAALDPVADSISKLQSLSTSLKGTLDSMALAGSDGIARSAAQGQISAALGTARSTGALPLDGQLDNALRTVAQPSEKLFATFTDYARDFYKTANDIAALADLTGTQLSADEAMQSTLDQQLDQAKESFDAQTAYFDSQIKAYEDQAKYAQELFDATTTGTLSVVDAITALQEAMKPGSTGTKNTANGGAEGIMGDAGDVWGTGYINNNKKPDNVSSYYGGFFDGYLDNVDAAKSAITGLDWSDPGAAINQLWQAQQESGGTLSNSVLSGASGFTQAEIEAMFASQGLQSFAVGTNYVPNDMIAQIHKGEAIIPAPYNPANGGSQDNGAMLAKLDAMLTRLERIESSNADIAGYTRRTDSTLIRVTRGGEQMQVSAA